MITSRSGSTMRLSLSFIALVSFAASGQALVEHSLITAASAAAGASATNAGKSTGGVFQNLGNLMDKAATVGKAGDHPTVTSEGVARSSVRDLSGAEPTLKIVDPSAITPGLERDELLSRFGAPLVSTIDTTASRITETMWYATGRSTQVRIQLVGGKVASISPPPLLKVEK